MDESPAPETASSDDKLWIILCHVSLLMGVGLVLPLVVYLVKKDSSALVAEHAREALNFHISFTFYTLISVILAFVLVGFLLIFVLSIGSLVLSILACIRAGEGKFFRYPLTIRLVS